MILELPTKIKYIEVVCLGGDPIPDSIHFDSESQTLIGTRCGLNMSKLPLIPKK